MQEKKAGGKFTFNTINIFLKIICKLLQDRGFYLMLSLFNISLRLQKETCPEKALKIHVKHKNKYQIPFFFLKYVLLAPHAWLFNSLVLTESHL